MGERYYVYAIAEVDICLPGGLSGFGGQPFVMSYGDLGAVVSLIRTEVGNEGMPEPTPENLLRHETVVEAIHTIGRTLPVRFGTVLANSEAVTNALARNYATLRDDLERIGDKVEVGVSVLWRAAEGDGDPATHEQNTGNHDGTGAVSAERPGLAYLRAQQVKHRQTESARTRAQTLARELDSELRPHALQQRRSVCPSARLALRDIYLLEREQLNHFEMAFDQARRRHPEVHFLLSGPWPPYSFITPSREADAAGGEKQA